MGNSGSNNRSGHKQFPHSRNFILPVSFGDNYNFIQRLTAMGEIQLAKITLWMLGIPVTGWAFWENLYQPGTWKADLLFCIAILILLTKWFFSALKWYQEYIERKQRLKSRDIDLLKKEHQNEEFIHDKNEE